MSAARGKARVLVVDDESTNRRLLELVLREHVQVLTAADGQEGLEMARAEHPDLVLADHKMPGMTGLEMLQQLRLEQPECVRILVTAYADRELLERAINDAAIYCFVRRPADPAMVRLQILRALEHRESERAAREHERLQLMGRLAASVAHDLSNYLSPVVAAPDELREGEPELTAEIIDMLESAGIHLTALCEEMHAIAKGRKPRYRRQACAPGDLLEEARRLCRGGAYATVQQDWSIEAGLPELQACPGRVVRLVANLVKNAAEATGPDGQVWVRCRVEGEQLHIEVEDDGPGVPESLRDRIFEPSFTTKADGGGLGLANCLRIAQGHGGNLALGTSAEGRTMFVASLPVT